MPTMNRILVLDDDTELCELLSDYLQPEGFAVSARHQARQGLACALSGEHDLVVLDVMLPGRSGFEILQELRAGESTRDLPVLMLTAKGQARDREMAERAGASRFLTKPFANTEIVAALRDLVGR